MPMASGAIISAPTTMQKTDAPMMAPPPAPSSSWEDMEYGGLQLGPLPHGVVVKNTFIDYPNAPDSCFLDEEPRGWRSCPNSGIMMMGPPSEELVPRLKGSEIQSLVIPEGDAESGSSTKGDAEEETSSSADDASGEKELGGLPAGLILKNTFIDYPTQRSESLDEYLDEKGWKSCPVSRMQSEVENQVSEIQAAIIAEEKEEELSGTGSEQEEEEKTTLRLLELLPRPEPVFSVGSVPHQLGQQCKPCGFVHKPEGCTNGANCQYCHLCPPGTIKQRKKVKKVILRQVWQQNPQRGWF